MTLRRAPIARRLCATPLLLLQTAFVIAQESVEKSAKLPFRTDGSAQMWRSGLSGIFSAVLILAIVAAALYFWRQRFRPGMGAVAASTKLAATLEWARRVSPRTTLMVVRWRGKDYLLAENGTVTQVVDSHAAEEPRL